MSFLDGISKINKGQKSQSLVKVEAENHNWKTLSHL